MPNSTASGCFCGQDTYGLVIECDKCHSEYHGTCVNITEAVARRIFKYTCAKCSNKKNGTDEILYSAAEEVEQSNEPGPPLEDTNRGVKTERKRMSDGNVATSDANVGTLIHRGFKFYRHCLSGDKSKVYYTCSKFKSHGCCCRVYTVQATGDVVDHRGQHNHPPNEEAEGVKRQNNDKESKDNAKQVRNAKAEPTPSAKPSAALDHQGFKYFRHAISADNSKIFWRCGRQNRAPDGCNARVHTLIATGDIVEHLGEHNHPPTEPYEDTKNVRADSVSKGRIPNKRHSSSASSKENAPKKPRASESVKGVLDRGSPSIMPMDAASSPLSVVQRLMSLPAGQRADTTKLFNSLLDEMDDDAGAQ